VRYPNVYGIDMPTSRELIANGRNDDEVAREIGADRLIYQDLDALIEDCRSVNPKVTNFEASCFSGSYITGDVTPEYLAGVEASRNDAELSRSNSIAAAQLVSIWLPPTSARAYIQAKTPPIPRPQYARSES
jgi:amidophosphoribosyltransferase